MSPAGNTIAATDRPRRPFHWRALEEAGARFADLDGAAVACGYGGGWEAELPTAEILGLADLSPLPRAGFKGRDALAWLSGQGFEVGEPLNRAWRQADGALVAKLAPTEALLLPAYPWRPVPVVTPPADGRLCFPVPRRDGSLWFRVTGAEAAAMFAKLCGVDLTPSSFPDLSIAQTSLARMSGIVIREDIARDEISGARETPLLSYHLLADSASAGYLWDCLTDAMAEYGGAPVGLSALARLVDPDRPA